MQGQRGTAGLLVAELAGQLEQEYIIKWKRLKDNSWACPSLKNQPV